jgi:hypothetical protein
MLIPSVGLKAIDGEVEAELAETATLFVLAKPTTRFADFAIAIQSRVTTAFGTDSPFRVLVSNEEEVARSRGLIRPDR